ncbi:MAG: glycosyltransferase, partial [Amnibacterium sp.]
TVVPGVSGALVERFEGDGLRAAVEDALRLDPHAIRESATRFSEAAFRVRIRDWVGGAIR